MRFDVSTKNRLVKASRILKDLGIEIRTDSIADKTTLAQIEELKPLDPDGAAELADVVRSIAAFNEVVAGQVRDMRVGERFETIRNNFQSIIADTEKMVRKAEEGKSDNKIVSAIKRRFVKISRGSIDARFVEIRNTAEQVFNDTNDQVNRETTILTGYREFRQSLKQATLISNEMFQKAVAARDVTLPEFEAAQKAVDDATAKGEDDRVIGMAELKRDEIGEELRKANERVDIASNLRANLMMLLGVSDSIMTRYAETAQVKETLLRTAATFYTANRGVLDTMRGALAQLSGLNETAEVITALKSGTEDMLSRMGVVGTAVNKKALEAAYSTGVSADTLRKLYDAVVTFKEEQQGMIATFRVQQEKSFTDIKKAVEDGNKRLSAATVGASRRQAQARVLPVAAPSLRAAQEQAIKGVELVEAEAPAVEAVRAATVEPIEAAPARPRL